MWPFSLGSDPLERIWERDFFGFLEGDELSQDDFEDSPQDDGNPPVLGPDELVGTSSHFGRV